jgi:hypothetical protein
MAFNLSTNVQAIFLDSRTRPGTVLLPSTFTVPGRTLTFKDLYGSFSTNTTTLTVNNTNQKVDIDQISTINRASFGWQTFIAGTNNNWYTVGGTLINTITTSTINSFLMSTSQISSGTISVSTLTLSDQVNASRNQVYTQSSFLYYTFGNTSTIISGTRQSFGGLFTPIRRSFAPNQISGLAFWFDASDPNTVVTSSANLVSQWLDKSGKRNSATLANGTVTTGSFLVNNLNTLSFASAAQMNLPNITFTSGNRSIFLVANIGASGNLYAFLAGATANTTTLLYIDSVNYLNYAKSLTQILAGTAPSEVYNRTALYSAKNVTNGLNVNGTAITLNQVNSPSAFNIGSAQEYLGQGPANATAAINYAEFILYDSDLAFPGQQQQVEGYLAWKWGLVGNLPSNHPYKLSPP